MPNWSPKAFMLPNTATRSLVFMSQELSTLCSRPSRALSRAIVKLSYMGGITLRDRLIEIADELGNDAEFARIAKVSRSAVSQWRAGDVKALKALSAVNIQERTGYSVRWIVLGLGAKKVHGKAEAGALAHITEHALTPPNDKKLLVVLKAFLDTDEEGRNQIVEAVKAITQNGPGQRQRGEQHGGTFKRRRGRTTQ